MKRITLGIAGGGQLAQMIADAAKKLNIKTIVLDPAPNSPAGQVADKQITGDFKDSKQVRKLFDMVDFLTFDVESVGVTDLPNNKIKINPSPKTLEVIQDKLSQKKFISRIKLPKPKFWEIKDDSDLHSEIESVGYPLILKARFHAYDGRGNAVIKNKKDVGKSIRKLENKKIYIEEFIPFKKEIAVQIIKSSDNKLTAFPIVETVQKNNICHIVKYPAGISRNAQKEALKIAKKIVKNLNGAGVYAVEMFLTKNDKVLVNEIAPRVHNSGHWTIEGCKTSQFENHVRAVCKLPINSTKPKTSAAVMINILGEINGKAKLLGVNKLESLNGVFLHIYGKFDTRIERKMGHITVLGMNLKQCLDTAQKARKMISI